MTGGRPERRRQARFEVHGVEGWVVHLAEVGAVNVSADGLAIESPAWLPVGRRYSVTFERRDEPLTVTGSVVWSSLVSTRKTPAGDVAPIYRAGIQFGGALTPRAEGILSFLREGSTFDPEARVFGRFDLPPGVSVTLEARQPVRLAELSLNGGLLEATDALEPGARVLAELDLDGAVVRPRGRIVHTSSNADGNGQQRCRMGVEWTEMDAEDRAVVARFLERRAGEIEDAGSPGATAD